MIYRRRELNFIVTKSLRQCFSSFWLMVLHGNSVWHGIMLLISFIWTFNNNIFLALGLCGLCLINICLRLGISVSGVDDCYWLVVISQKMELEKSFLMSRFGVCLSWMVWKGYWYSMNFTSLETHILSLLDYKLDNPFALVGNREKHNGSPFFKLILWWFVFFCVYQTTKNSHMVIMWFSIKQEFIRSFLFFMTLDDNILMM